MVMVTDDVTFFVRMIHMVYISFRMTDRMFISNWFIHLHNIKRYVVFVVDNSSLVPFLGQQRRLGIVCPQKSRVM